MPGQIKPADPEGANLAEPDTGVREEQDDESVGLVGAGVVAGDDSGDRDESPVAGGKGDGRKRVEALPDETCLA